MGRDITFRKFKNGVLVKRLNSRVFVAKTDDGGISLYTKILVANAEDLKGYTANPKFTVKRNIAHATIKFQGDTFQGIVEAYIHLLHDQVKEETLNEEVTTQGLKI